MVGHSNIIRVLPLGAHEYHGSHLPFETDTIIADAFAKNLIKGNNDNYSLQVLPVEKTGYSIEHMDVIGTQSFSYEKALGRWIAIGKEAYKAGIKKLLILNAHGGNSALMSIVITELRCRFPMLAVATSWSRFGLPAGLISDEEKHLDIHGGFIETSLMLHLRPDLVKMELVENFSNNQSEFISHYHYLRAYGPHAFGWKMRDLNPKGAAGNASKATAMAGKAIFEHAANGLNLLIQDIADFDVETLDT